MKILIGHAEKENTGVTVIIAPEGAVAGVDVRGGAPGTRETDLLRTGNTVEKIHAVALCGGSAYGLAAADGIMKYLSERNIGFKAGRHIVPIVPAAVIFDLDHPVSPAAATPPQRGIKVAYPDADLGYKACVNAKEDYFESGRLGAGKGATIGKFMGIPSHGGIGCATVKLGNIITTAIIVCNAAGDIYDMDTGKVISGAHDGQGNFIDQYKTVLGGAIPADKRGQNTTIGAIITNATLTKEQANKAAAYAHDGLAMSIRPVHTMMDGDTLFCLSREEVTADFNLILLTAAEAVRQAVIASV
jgi:L-aminopeptidase/D-esterase-like protein